MLRFDLPPVLANAARADGLLTFLIAALALLNVVWLVPLLIVQGFVRGFIGHQRCPSHRLFALLLQKAGFAGKKENAGAKMFASKLLFIASSMASVLYFAGSGMWVVPVSVLLVFSFLEWAFSFCVACWARTAWYRLRSQG
ncbi:DUF4395 family protein [Uliginosibacterium paludis]|uniref:DUF4395 family protein n=1 Tax=Uliginosibacterium paludis TaxID=1615952 RepID=A0ABV2CM76_9RHOO